MPKPDHVEALALIFCPDPISAIREDRGSTAPIVAATLDSQRVLAAICTDPAVQDAVLAALVEGGRLVEEARTYIDGGRAIGHRLVESEWRGATP